MDSKMTPQLQKNFLHLPKKGIYGDCLRTCLACILDKPLDDIPNFMEGIKRGGLNSTMQVLDKNREWLSKENKTLFFFIIPVQTQDAALSYIGHFNSTNRWILNGGTKDKGINHSVCCYGNKIEHDPAPSPVGGINGPLWPDRKVFSAAIIGVL